MDNPLTFPNSCNNLRLASTRRREIHRKTSKFRTAKAIPIEANTTSYKSMARA